MIFFFVVVTVVSSAEARSEARGGTMPEPESIQSRGRGKSERARESERTGCSLANRKPECSNVTLK